MVLKDRKRLARLMAIEGVSQRELARAAGWSAHSYMSRLLNGEAKTLAVGPAIRIAQRLQVDVHDLFLPRASSVTDVSHSRKEAA